MTLDTKFDTLDIPLPIDRQPEPARFLAVPKWETTHAPQPRRQHKPAPEGQLSFDPADLAGQMRLEMEQ